MLAGTQATDVVDTRWVLTRMEAGGKKTLKARLAAKGYQDPDLKDGNVVIGRCVIGRSAHLQLTSLGALKKGPRNASSGLRSEWRSNLWICVFRAIRFSPKPQTLLPMWHALSHPFANVGHYNHS